MGMSDFWVDHGGTAYVLIRARVAVQSRTAVGLREVVGRELRAGRRFLAVDLSDSAVYGPRGFSALIGALKSCRDRGGELYLIGASPTVVGVLGHDSRGPVRCFGSRGELDRALSGCAAGRGA